jgi:CspA family cold shock protein
MERYTGKVIWFAAKKGYGFIEFDGRPDLFVHWSDLKMDGFKVLKKEQMVEFGLGINNNNQPKAIEVKLIEEVHTLHS